jgi:hypothetical protein
MKALLAGGRIAREPPKAVAEVLHLDTQNHQSTAQAETHSTGMEVLEVDKELKCYWKERHYTQIAEREWKVPLIGHRRVQEWNEGLLVPIWIFS